MEIATMSLCKFCGFRGHTVEQCRNRLQIENNGLCPFCHTRDHHWKVCPSKQSCENKTSDEAGHASSSQTIDDGFCSADDGDVQKPGTSSHLKDQPSMQSPPQSVPKQHQFSMTVRADGTVHLDAHIHQIATLMQLLKDTQKAKGDNNNGHAPQHQRSRSEREVHTSDGGATAAGSTPAERDPQRITAQIPQQTAAAAAAFGLTSTQYSASYLQPASQTGSRFSKYASPPSPSPPPPPPPFRQLPSQAKQGNGLANQLNAERPPRPLQHRSELSPDESNYLEVLQLVDEDLWPTFAPFDCPSCGLSVDTFEGVVLKDCQIHKICRACLRMRVLEAPFREIRCYQFAECGAKMLESEIESLLEDVADKQVYHSKMAQVDAENDPLLIRQAISEDELLPNFLQFTCPVCLESVPPFHGVIPKNCGRHQICRDCLRGAVNCSDIAMVSCPVGDCTANLEDREVRLLVSDEEYDALHKKGLVKALGEAMKCRTPNCAGTWFTLDEDDNDHFECPLCHQLN